MEETTHYKLLTLLGHNLYLTVQVKEQRPTKDQSVVLLGLYAENTGVITLSPLGSSRLTLEAHNGSQPQSFTFPTLTAAPGETCWLAKGLEAVVTHAPDGTAPEIPFSWVWNISRLGGSAPTGECAIELPPLDLATTPNIYTTNYYKLADTMQLALNPHQRNFTHNLFYDILGTTGQIMEGVSGRQEWLIPTELLTALTSCNYVPVELVCDTYRGSVFLGQKRRSFYLKPGDAGRMQAQEGWCCFVPESGNDTVDRWGVYLEGSSLLRAVPDYSKVTLAPGAEVVKAQLYMDTRPLSGLSSPILRECVRHTFRLVLTDSRGFTIAHTETVTPCSYVPPALASPACFRSDADGLADDAGSFLSVSYIPVYSPVDSHNEATVELRLYTPGGTLLQTQRLDGSGVYGGNLSAQASYLAVLVITDSLGNTGSVSFTLPSQKVTFQLREGGDGAAFGGLALEADCLDIYWNRLKLGGQELADFVTERGQSGIWHYEKWRSGLARCWGLLAGTAAVSTPTGGLYQGSCAPVKFPFAFLEAPTIAATPEAGGMWWVAAPTAQGSATQTPNFCLLCPESGSIQYRLALFCTGRWK